MCLKTEQSSCLTKKNVLLILMIIQIIMAFLISKYYLENIWGEKKPKPNQNIWIWVIIPQGQIQ